LPVGESKWSELYLYNSIPLIAIGVIILAKHINDRLTQPLLAAAFFSWFIGSVISSSSSYTSISATLSNTAYLLFYPFAIIALPRLITPGRKFSILELFDASIVGLGLSVLGTVLILKPVLPHFDDNLSEAFFAIAFPLSDLILISLTLTAILSSGY
jgi:hypothetical protein